MSKIKFENLSPELQAELMAQAAEANRKQQEGIKAERESYKQLVNDVLPGIFHKLVSLSNSMAAGKKEVFDSMSNLIAMKCELYGVKDGQQSHTFSTLEGNLRLTLGYHVTDNYDDTVNAGVEKVKAYLQSLANTPETQALVDMVNKLLSKDNAGNLKASRVLQLSQMAEKSGNAEFIDGVGIIREAYKPIPSKHYIRADYKDDESGWKSIPLGVTEVDQEKLLEVTFIKEIAKEAV